MGDFEPVEVGKELGDGILGSVIRAHDGEIGAFELVDFPALRAEKPCETASNGSQDVVPHFRTIRIVHYDHVVHVNDREGFERFGIEVLDKLVAVRQSR